MGPPQAYQYTPCRHLRRKREKRTERTSEEIISVNVLHLVKDINIQEAQQAPDKMKKSETHTKTHCNQTFKKQREL